MMIRFFGLLIPPVGSWSEGFLSSFCLSHCMAYWSHLLIIWMSDTPLPYPLSLFSLFLWLDDCTCRSWHTRWTLRRSNSLSPSHFTVSSLQIVTQLYIWSMTELTITMRKGGNVNTSGLLEKAKQTSQMTIYTINRVYNIETWTKWCANRKWCKTPLTKLDAGFLMLLVTDFWRIS